MRLNDHQLIQRVEHEVVILDENTGEEVSIYRADLARLRHSIGVLFPFDTQYLDEDSYEDALDEPENYAERYPEKEWIAG